MCNIIAASEDSKNSSFYGLKTNILQFQHFWRENSNICWIDFTVQLTLISRTKGACISQDFLQTGFYLRWNTTLFCYFVLPVASYLITWTIGKKVFWNGLEQTFLSIISSSLICWPTLFSTLLDSFWHLLTYKTIQR